jgi:hypothetical protein
MAAECQYLSACPFFNEKLPNMPSMTAYLKSAYCRREYEECARYMVRQALGKDKVPIDLFPDETNLAVRLIAAKT